MVHHNDCHDKTDEELVALVLRDKEYYMCLMARYEEKLLRYLRSIGRLVSEDYEDILQNAFLKAYINLNDFDHSFPFKNWIYRIVHNEFIDFIRKRKIKNMTLSLDTNTEDTRALLDRLSSDVDVERDVDRKVLEEHMSEVLALLPMEYREVIVLKYFEERDYREISDILQKPIGTVATLLNRAKALLKQKATVLFYKDI